MTMQIRDRLSYDGVDYYIVEGPTVREAIPVEEFPEFRSITTASDRGYVSTWLIADGFLYLTSVNAGWSSHMTYRDGRVVTISEDREVLDRLFPERSSPVLADWFTGEVIVGNGESFFGRSPYFALYPRYLIFLVYRGKLLAVDERDAEWWNRIYS